MFRTKFIRVIEDEIRIRKVFTSEKSSPKKIGLHFQ